MQNAELTIINCYYPLFISFLFCTSAQSGQILQEQGEMMQFSLGEKNATITSSKDIKCHKT